MQQKTSDSQQKPQPSPKISTVVVGIADSRKKKLIVALCALVVITTIIAGSTFILSNYKKSNKPAQLTQSELYESKKAELEKNLKNASNEQIKTATTQDLTQLALDNADAKTALYYAKNAVALNPNANNYAQLGFAAQQTGDKQQAIEAYKKAAKLNQVSNDPRSNYMYYTSRWQILEAQK